MPTGWPAEVHPPGTERFEDTAVAWLIELLPPDYRQYGVLRRYPIALARMARHHLSGCLEAAREGFRTARVELSEAVPPHAIEAVLDTYRHEGPRLTALLRSADLVEQALRGKPFTPEL